MTVAATMKCAHKAGIPLFITGGLGGVHRDGETSKFLPIFFKIMVNFLRVKKISILSSVLLCYQLYMYMYTIIIHVALIHVFCGSNFL